MPFFYSDMLTLEFHIESVTELVRIARQVRIFPLVDVNANRARYIEEIGIHARQLGRKVKEITEGYVFKKGGNTMLIIE